MRELKLVGIGGNIHPDEYEVVSIEMSCMQLHKILP